MENKNDKIDFNNGEWIKKKKNGRIFYDHISICKPLPKYDLENEIYQSFCDNFVFEKADNFKNLEEKFLKVLTFKQKKLYLEIFEQIQAYHVEREKKLISYARRFGRVVFD